MNIALWIVQGVLAAVFFSAGLMLFVRSKTQLYNDPAMSWSKPASQNTIWLIGLAEIAGAAGLLLPALIGILPGLVPLAGLGLALLMAGAVFTHLRLRQSFTPALVFGLLSLTVFAGRQWMVPL